LSLLSPTTSLTTSVLLSRATHQPEPTPGATLQLAFQTMTVDLVLQLERPSMEALAVQGLTFEVQSLLEARCVEQRRLSTFRCCRRRRACLCFNIGIIRLPV